MIGALDVNANLPCSTLLSVRRLSDAARGRMRPDMNVRRYLDALLEDGLPADAVDVLCHVLPKRYAIGWALECLQADGAPERNPVDRSALATVQRWLQDPSEDNRRAAMELADRLHYDSAGAWLAAAAGWSGGSLAPADLPEVKPSPVLSGEAVAAALKVSAASKGSDFTGALRGFIDRALATFGLPEPGGEPGDDQP